MQTPNQRFKTALIEIRDRVVTGESFTDALKDYDKYFDVIYVAMVRVGEVTGTLGESLKTIANFMEKRQRVESKVLTVMIYPVVLVCFCLLAVLILTTKVIPTIGEQIKRAGQELPWITQQLMNFSGVLTSWRVLILLAGLVLIVMAIPAVLPDRAGGLPAGPVPAFAAHVRAADQAAGGRPVRLDALDADRLRACPWPNRSAWSPRRRATRSCAAPFSSRGSAFWRGPTSPPRCGTAA